eukprot:jgi/Mesen1/1827/ME000142S00992
MASSKTHRRILAAMKNTPGAVDVAHWVAKHVSRPGDTIYVLYVQSAYDVTTEVASLEILDSHVAQAQQFVHGSEVTVKGHLEWGEVPVKIVEFADKLDADLIVLGNRQQGTLHRLKSRSIGKYCSKNATCPILIVKTRVGRDGASLTTRSRTVIVAADSPGVSREAWQWALLNLLRGGDVVIFVHVQKAPVAACCADGGSRRTSDDLMPLDPNPLGESLSVDPGTPCGACECIDKLALQPSHTEGLRLVVERRVLQGDAKELLLEEAERVNAHLIVLGSRGVGKLKSMITGSVSSHLIHHSACSLLVMRPRELPEDC